MEPLGLPEVIEGISEGGREDDGSAGGVGHGEARCHGKPRLAEAGRGLDNPSGGGGGKGKKHTVEGDIIDELVP
jgi:hypothetical protein